RFIEVEERGGSHAIGAHAEIYFIEIELEYSLLGEGALYLHRQQRLLDLAREGELVCEQKILGDLLGDGGGALRPPAAAVLLYIEHRGAGDAGGINAAVLVEIFVLGGHECVDDEFRYRLDGDVKSPLARIFGKQRAVGCVHARHDRRLIVLQLGIVRKRLRVVPQQTGCGGDGDDEYDRSCREQ